MSYSIQLSSQLVLSHYNSYSVGYAILYTNWLICEVVWLAWLQLPVVFKYRLVTALVPLASDSRILSTLTVIPMHIYSVVKTMFLFTP
jgi:hypothetical protein